MIIDQMKPLLHFLLPIDGSIGDGYCAPQ